MLMRTCLPLYLHIFNASRLSIKWMVIYLSTMDFKHTFKDMGIDGDLYPVLRIYEAKQALGGLKCLRLCIKLGVSSMWSAQLVWRMSRASWFQIPISFRHTASRHTGARVGEQGSFSGEGQTTTMWLEVEGVTPDKLWNPPAPTPLLLYLKCITFAMVDQNR